MHLHILTTSQQIVKHSAKTSDDCQRNTSHNHDDHQTFWNDCWKNVGNVSVTPVLTSSSSFTQTTPVVYWLQEYTDIWTISTNSWKQHRFVKNGAGKKLCLKLKNRMICNQLQIWSVFSYAGRSPSMMEIVENSVAVNLTEVLAELAKQYCFLKKVVFIH